LNKKNDSDQSQEFINWFRAASPYVNAHRGRTFVLVFAGDAVLDKRFDTLIHDIAILNSLGIRLLLVHGARPQIEKRLKREQIDTEYKNGLRITDSHALECVKEAVGSIRVEVESLLSMGVANTPMAGAHIRVASGNFVTAQPLGVRDGVDFQHTGEVRRLDIDAIRDRLDHGDIVLLSPSGYSPTGEIFNLSAEDVATSTAIELQADKLIFLLEGSNLLDGSRQLIRELSPAEADRLLSGKRKLSDEIRTHLRSAVHACRFGVPRAHLIQRKTDGALLQELFTRDGAGTLITGETIEALRTATIDDVGGIIELLKPLEESGALVKRSRELLEIEIDQYIVIEREGMIIACAAMHPYHKERVAELACLAVHPQYQDSGRGELMLVHIEKQAKSLGMKKLMVLTTQTAHWFQEKGFVQAEIKSLPVKRKNLYNIQRKSKIFYKLL
jgi:amino-acid N-acetyltransferase